MLVLDRELHVLHVLVMVLKGPADSCELIIDLRHQLLQPVDLLGRPDACDDILALRIQEELAHQTLLAGRRVSRESDARSGGVAHVSERHHLDVDSRPPGVRNVVVPSVHVRARIVPGTENRLDRLDQLFLRVIREVLPELLSVLRLELIRQLMKVVRIQLDVLRYSLSGLHLVDQLLKVLLADLHDDIREHLDESSVAVPCPSGIPALLRKNAYNILVQSQVQDRVHHARHGRPRS